MNNVNLLRILVTVAAFAAYLGIVLWSFAPKSRKRFDEAAHLPFAHDDAAGDRQTGAGNKS